MPLNKYDNKRLVSVPLDNGLNYVFATNVDATASTALGHVAVPALVPALSFQGGNSPKPRRARRLTADGWNSSFITSVAATIVTAKTAGYQVSNQPKKRGLIPASGSRATTVYVTVRGIKYAWNMPNETITTITQATLTALGVNIATASDVNTLVWGASLPQPAKAQFFNVAGPGGGDVLSTFVGQAQEDNLPNGWRLIRPRIMFLGDP
ncbi:hypothetical protein [Microcoleus anatoxicus]|uniref:hypothetical protein n=1 Tax=Microcoleus anatoxicus TaxID=2705319 RepID=UPI0030CA12B0